MERLALPKRVDRRLLPPVELVSSLESRGVLHPQTLEALGAVGDRGEKAIVLLNRRGWSNFLSCRSCGRVWQCRQCDVALVLHRASGRIACHHCGRSEVVPPACLDCGSVSLARHGAGTERLEDELTRLLAPLPVFRLDADSASDRGAIPALLRRFDSAAAGVLVGTQMVAKGHDFPDVTLGVVYAPATGDLLWAQRGRGAFANGAPLRVSTVDRLAAATLVHSSLRLLRGAEDGRYWDGFVRLVDRTDRQRGFGDYLAYTFVLRGQAEVALEADLKPWDLAPFVVLFEEAGGRFTDFAGRRTIYSGTALASNGRLHGEVLALLAGAPP